MTLRDKMLAVMQDVNSQVAEREELVELIAIALLTRKRWLEWGMFGVAGIGACVGVLAFLHI